GIYVPQGDPDALRKTILELWYNPAKAVEMGRAGRRYVEQYHSQEHFVRIIRGIILDAVKGPSDKREQAAVMST
ncbi:MAG TPA: hypothetical protein VKA68_07115, partial [bacterium]|nr:hypothetical protein [bacterium]